MTIFQPSCIRGALIGAFFLIFFPTRNGIHAASTEMLPWAWVMVTTERIPTRLSYSRKKIRLGLQLDPSMYDCRLFRCDKYQCLDCIQVRFGDCNLITVADINPVLVTSESCGNLRVCGFGSGGRSV